MAVDSRATGKESDKKKGKGKSKRLKTSDNAEPVPFVQTPRGQAMDQKMTAKKIRNPQDPADSARWAKRPNRSDLNGVDTEGGELIPMQEVGGVYVPMKKGDMDPEEYAEAQADYKAWLEHNKEYEAELQEDLKKNPAVERGPDTQPAAKGQVSFEGEAKPNAKPLDEQIKNEKQFAETEQWRENMILAAVKNSDGTEKGILKDARGHHIYNDDATRALKRLVEKGTIKKTEKGYSEIKVEPAKPGVERGPDTQPAAKGQVSFEGEAKPNAKPLDEDRIEKRAAEKKKEQNKTNKLITANRKKGQLDLGQAGFKWTEERKEEANRVSKQLGIGTFEADALVQKAERAGLQPDQVNWDELEGGDMSGQEMNRKLEQQIGAKARTEDEVRAEIEAADAGADEYEKQVEQDNLEYGIAHDKREPEAILKDMDENAKEQVFIPEDWEKLGKDQSDLKGWDDKANSPEKTAVKDELAERAEETPKRDIYAETSSAIATSGRFSGANRDEIQRKVRRNGPATDAEINAAIEKLKAEGKIYTFKTGTAASERFNIGSKETYLPLPLVSRTTPRNGTDERDKMEKEDREFRDWNEKYIEEKTKAQEELDKIDRFKAPKKYEKASEKLDKARGNLNDLREKFNRDETEKLLRKTRMEDRAEDDSDEFNQLAAYSELKIIDYNEYRERLRQAFETRRRQVNATDQEIEEMASYMAGMGAYISVKDTPEKKVEICAARVRAPVLVNTIMHELQSKGLSEQQLREARREMETSIWPEEIERRAAYWREKMPENETPFDMKNKGVLKNFAKQHPK